MLNDPYDCHCEFDVDIKRFVDDEYPEYKDIL